MINERIKTDPHPPSDSDSHLTYLALPFAIIIGKFILK